MRRRRRLVSHRFVIVWKENNDPEHIKVILIHYCDPRVVLLRSPSNFTDYCRKMIYNDLMPGPISINIHLSHSWQHPTP